MPQLGHSFSSWNLHPSRPTHRVGAQAQCSGHTCSPHAGAPCSWGERCPALPVTRAVKAASAPHVPWGSHQQTCAELISYSRLTQGEKCCSTEECLWKVYYRSGDSLPGRGKKQQVLVTSLDEIQREQASLLPGPSTEDPGTRLRLPGCVHTGSRGASTATSRSLHSQTTPGKGPRCSDPAAGMLRCPTPTGTATGACALLLSGRQRSC